MRIHITLDNVTETSAMLDKGAELGMLLVSQDNGSVVFEKTLTEPIEADQVHELYTEILQSIDAACWSTTVVEY